MAARTTVVNHSDFTGGLNMSDNLMQVGTREVTKCLNMEPGRRGGMHLRAGSEVVFEFTPLVELDPTDAALYGFGGLRGYTHPDGTEWLTWTTEGCWVQSKLDGSDFGGTIDTATSPFSSAVMNGAVYAVHPEATACYRFDGTVDVLGHSWSPDFDAPTNDNMPLARVCAAHAGYMFVAATVESSVNYDNRIRWSHPNKPDAWREEDYIDVGGDERITALLSFGGLLLIFKQSAVYALRGDSIDTFAYDPIDDAVGCVGHDACAASPAAAYFWSAGSGAWSFDGRKMTWVGMPLRDGVLNGKILSEKVCAGYARGRVWFGVGWVDGDEHDVYGGRRALMYDERVGSGAWSVHSHALHGLYWHRGSDVVYATASTVSLLLILGPEGGYVPVYSVHDIKEIDSPRLVGDDGEQIGAYFRTAWFDAGQPAQRKKWRRLRFFMRHRDPAVVTYKVYKDFDATAQRGSGSIIMPQDPAISVYGTGVYGTSVYAVEGDADREKVALSPGLGSSLSVMIQFDGPAAGGGNPVSWGVDHIAFPVQPRRIR